MCYIYGHMMHGEFSLFLFPSSLPLLPLHFSQLCTTCTSSLQPLTFLTEFYGIELWMLRKAIEALGREGKAELIPGDNPDGSDAGVKFFS